MADVPGADELLKKAPPPSTLELARGRPRLAARRSQQPRPLGRARRFVHRARRGSRHGEEVRPDRHRLRGAPRRRRPRRQDQGRAEALARCDRPMTPGTNSAFARRRAARWSPSLRRCVTLAVWPAASRAAASCSPATTAQSSNCPAANCRSASTSPRKKAASCCTWSTARSACASTEVTAADGRLTATMPGYENTLSAEIRGERAARRGVAAARRRRAAGAAVPRRGGPDLALLRGAATDNADVAGRWSMTFTSDDGQAEPGRRGIHAVVRARHRHDPHARPATTASWPGEVRGDELYLSRFDGASAYLYRAKVDEDGRPRRASTGRARPGTSASAPSAIPTPCSTRARWPPPPDNPAPLPALSASR